MNQLNRASDGKKLKIILRQYSFKISLFKNNL